MNESLEIKYNILQKRNKVLEAEILALKYERANFIDSINTHIRREKEDHKIFFELKSLIKEQFVYTNALKKVIDMSEIEISLADNEIEIQGGQIDHQASTIEKYTKAPRTNKLNTDALWEPYIQIFDDYIVDGKTETWAKNKIGELMEKDGAWKKTSKNKSKEIITRPDRGTLHRQLVTNRK
jgi:hypothetical protein